MVEAPYLMGIDFGTGGVRVGLFDRAGTPVVFRAETFPTQYPRPSWAEQDPGDWWLGLVTAVRGAVNDSGIAPRDIAGISVDATSSTVLAVDRHDRYMGLALLWMDVRAAVQARRIEATAHPALKYNGFGAVSAEWGLPKAMWLKENRPEVWAEAGYLCDCADWVVQRLTGEWASSINIASAKFYYDRDTGGFPESLYQQVGLDDFLDKYPSAVIDLGVVVGLPASRRRRGDGPGPGHAGRAGRCRRLPGRALGLGVVKPGTLALITGSSHVMIAQAADAVHGSGFWGAYTDAMIPGQYTIEAGQVSTGSVVAWFKDHFAGEAADEASRRGIDAYEVLTERAGQVAPGSDGLVVVDYFQGNRSPYTDPHVRGMIWDCP